MRREEIGTHPKREGAVKGVVLVCGKSGIGGMKLECMSRQFSYLPQAPQWLRKAFKPR